MPNETRSQPWMIATIVLGIALVLALVFLFTGSPDGEPESSASTTIGEVATTVAGTPSDQLAIVVDNAPAARPQTGIADAPLLIEYPVEGGMTRFTVVMSIASGATVGPVRSLRPVNALLLPVLTSAVASSGGQPFVVQDVEAAGLTSVTPDLAPGFGSAQRGGDPPHDLYLSLDELAEMFVPDAAVSGLPTGGLPETSIEVTGIDLPFGVSFDYVAEAGYVRRQDGAPFQVRATPGDDLVELSHDVIVVLFAAERAAGYSDSNDVPVSTFDVIGSGDLLVLHEGRMWEGSWSRSALVDPFLFTDSARELFGLPEGRVYLAIVPRQGQVTTR